MGRADRRTPPDRRAGGLARLRFFVTGELHEDDVRRAVAILAEEVAAAGG
ncbi:hypothetical protein [Streptomyces sp. YGL11-2]